MKLKIVTFLILPFAIICLVASNKINPNNPPAGRTGAPGETTCQASGCHAGGAFTGTVELTGVPDTVVANTSYTLTLTNTSDAVRSGFQLTVLDKANTKVGTLTAGAGCSLANAGGRQYVRQSSPRNLTGGSTSWSFTWKAPAEVANDSIFFYFASLCADGNGQKTGDNALKNSKAVVLPAMVSSVGDKVADFDFQFYPNPAKDFVMIEIPGKGKAEILDENGRVVLQTVVVNSKRLDITKLKNGLYFSKIEMNGESQTRIFLKN